MEIIGKDEILSKALNALNIEYKSHKYFNDGSYSKVLLLNDEYIVKQSNPKAIEAEIVFLKQSTYDKMQQPVYVENNNNFAIYNYISGSTMKTSNFTVSTEELIEELITVTNGYNEYEANTYCNNPDHNHVSVDNMVDTSTAILPENTWIFLNQHHEVGYNDVVLNLAKAIILGEVTDVHSDPVNYPQYNGPCYTQSIRRWKLPDAKKVDQTTLSEEDKAELNAAIAECEEVLKMTIADQSRVEAAEARIITALHNVSAPGYENIEPDKESALDPVLEGLTYMLSKGSLALFGGGSPLDAAVPVIKKVFNRFFK